MSSFLLIGNRLCIDFANTLTPHSGPLESWYDLQLFMSECSPDLAATQAAAPASLGDHDEAFTLGLELRAAAQAMAAEIIDHHQVPHDHVNVINRVLALGRGAERLERSENGWDLHFAPDRGGPAALLVPIARSLAELAAEGPDAPVRRCADPRCGLMFYDTSRTRRRRWCRMSACGNRSKVARYFMRHEARAPEIRRGLY